MTHLLCEAEPNGSTELVVEEPDIILLGDWRSVAEAVSADDVVADSTYAGPWGNLVFFFKRDAENPIHNTLNKTTSAIFSAYKKPTGVCLQS